MQAFKKMELCTMVSLPYEHGVIVARVVASRFEETGGWTTGNFTVYPRSKKFYSSQLVTYPRTRKGR
jgi:hypothetical protein